MLFFYFTFKDKMMLLCKPILRLLNQNTLNTKENCGFTLIELLVVVIIISVLSIVALPNMLEQVRKGRETEARSNLGAINRAQQAHRFEMGTFANLSELSATFVGRYYSFATSGTPNSEGAIHTATVESQFNFDTKDYSSAVGQNSSGGFTEIICQQNVADGAIAPIPPTVTAGIPACSAGTKSIF